MRPSLIPRQLARRPRDKRGYPIPYTVAYDASGQPQFPVVDPRKWQTVVREHRCGLCAARFKGVVSSPRHVAEGCLIASGLWFIGGPLCFENRYFYDPGMCEHCARYAITVCPYLALRSYRRTMPEGDLEKGIVTIPIVETGRPPRFMLGRAPGYAIRSLEGNPIILANPWLEVEWWKAGERIA